MRKKKFAVLNALYVPTSYIILLHRNYIDRYPRYRGSVDDDRRFTLTYRILKSAVPWSVYDRTLGVTRCYAALLVRRSCRWIDVDVRKKTRFGVGGWEIRDTFSDLDDKIHAQFYFKVVRSE